MALRQCCRAHVRSEGDETMAGQAVGQSVVHSSRNVAGTLDTLDVRERVLAHG